MKKLYSAIKYLLLLAVAAILLWVSFKGVQWEDFIRELKSANLIWIALSMVVGVFAFAFRALRWRLLILPLGQRVKHIDTWDGTNIGYLVNFALPRAGEFARCGVISKQTGLPFEAIAGTVVLERSIDLFTLLLVSLAVLFFKWNKFGTFINREIVEVASQSMSVNLLWVAIAILIALSLFLYTVYLFRKTNPLFKKIAGLLKGVISGVISGFKMPQKWLFLLYTIAIYICYWLMSYTTILAFPAVSSLGATDALFLMIVGSFGWVVPVQGGIGAYHFIISLALASIYSIDQTTGVVFATISHESQAITMLLFGSISLISFYLRKRVRS